MLKHRRRHKYAGSTIQFIGLQMLACLDHFLNDTSHPRLFIRIQGQTCSLIKRYFDSRSWYVGCTGHSNQSYLASPNTILKYIRDASHFVIHVQNLDPLYGTPLKCHIRCEVRSITRNLIPTSYTQYIPYYCALVRRQTSIGFPVSLGTQR